MEGGSEIMVSLYQLPIGFTTQKPLVQACGLHVLHYNAQSRPHLPDLPHAIQHTHDLATQYNNPFLEQTDRFAHRALDMK